MMSVWHLIWILPVVACIGYATGVLMAMAGRDG